VSQTIPKLEELQPLATSILRADTYFAAASSGISDDDESANENSVVIQNVGLQQPVIEQRLRTKGFCVAVMPVLGSARRDQSGQSWIADCDLLIKVKVNPERNANNEEGGAGVNIYTAIKNVIDAVTGQKVNIQNKRHPGGEFFKLHKEGFALSQFDEGLWEYNVMFTKEAML
jgi:hypothetical protein